MEKLIAEIQKEIDLLNRWIFRTENGCWSTFNHEEMTKRRDELDELKALLHDYTVNSTNSTRAYTKDITKQKYGDLYTVDEWKESVENGWIMDDDGSGYWVKDGLECRDCDVFYSEPKDATHVMWYNK